jgi:hypothetical protein
MKSVCSFIVRFARNCALFIHFFHLLFRRLCTAREYFCPEKEVVMPG